MVGNSRQEVDMVVVPREEVATLEAEGWEVYASMTKNWRPGHLIGDNGSDPATISQSPSFAPASRWNETSERRSATSTGHILQYRRPPGVPLGWGGYDEFTYWQSCGRRVTKDMVKKEEWSTSPLAPITIVKESGEFVETVTLPVKQEDLPPQPKKPVPLYDLLNSGTSQKRKAPTKDDSGTSTWADIYKGN
ncbi:hypothetical protein M441DRAFT_457780 [Trichoderma asperellum CBS 433.97]|uniref:Uncharacterized protein n=1 Tax=Trichoderma asperellum (strain ATCC 204424 / CBS 433.97 / NBRC 101777) TaxID=1042311 RepID=A0A2T3ZAE3_TRIA4|nr:hypothetical protein M441DRAFT_457780 [Trichoderma asperellum CBS 433.97]PTB41774.1 hypothetical protein M441DRAFT_457780 [Trichoderma asperellum CBS 433.97]